MSNVVNLLLTKNNRIVAILILWFLVVLLEWPVVLAQEGLSRQQWQQLTQIESSSAGSKAAESNAADEDPSPFKQAEGEAKPATGSAEAVQTPATTEAPAAVVERRPEENYTTGVTLQALNKITARTTKLDVQLDKPIKFGNLNISLRACWHSPPEETTESKALLEIWEEIPGEIRKKIFGGWMFASSPLISAPEHPIYDIIVLSCTGPNIHK